jgi:hypothetical protein
MRKLPIAILSLVALAAPAAAFGQAADAGTAAEFRRCAPPTKGFYDALKAKGVGCAKARKVIMRTECENPKCTELTSGAWECTVEGGIARPTTRCERDEDRIVARGAGQGMSGVRSS